MMSRGSRNGLEEVPLSDTVREGGDKKKNGVDQKGLPSQQLG